MRIMMSVRLSIMITALLIIGLIGAPARSQSDGATSTSIVCQCLQIEQTGSGETGIDLFIKLGENGWMRMGGINANTDENTPESIAKTFKNRILMGLRVNFPEAFSSDEEGDKLKLRAQPVDPTDPAGAWKILITSTADLPLSIKAQTDGESFTVSTQKCEEEDLNPPDVPDDVQREPPTEDEETESEEPEETEETQEEQQPDRDEEENTEPLPVGEPPRFISPKGATSTKIDPEKFEFKFELKKPDTRTVRCGEGGKDRGKCRIIYTATVMTRPVVSEGGKIVDLAYHWEVNGRITIDAQSCTCELQVFEDLDATSIQGITRNKVIKPVSNCQNAKFLFRSGWKSISENFPDAKFNDAAKVTLDFSFNVDKQCEGCREIRTPKKPTVFGKTTYTGLSNVAEDPPIFTEPISQGILDPIGDVATKFSGIRVSETDQDAFSYLDIVELDSEIRISDAVSNLTVSPMIHGQLVESNQMTQLTELANTDGTPLGSLEIQLSLRGSIPQSIDSELTVYIFIIDADGDVDTGPPDSLIPDIGGDFSVSIFPATSGLSEFASLSVWNPESQGFERFNELVAFSFEQDRTSIRVTIDLDSVVNRLSQISDVAFDREVYDFAVFSWEMNNAFSGRLPPPRDEGIADFAPDFHYQPTASEFTEIPPLPESPTLKVPDNFATIDEAILAAAPGDTIVVGPGTYRGDFEIDIPLTLKAKRPGTVVLQGIREGALFIVDTNDVVIEEITVTGAGDGVFIQDSNNVTLRNVTVQRNGRFGVFVIGSRNVTVENSRILDHPDRGFFAEDSQNIVLEGNKILNNTVAGIDVRNVTITIRNNRVSNTQFASTPEFADGIVILDGSTATLIDNAIQNNGTCGVFGENSTITGSGNTLSGNGDGNLCGDVPPTL